MARAAQRAAESPRRRVEPRRRGTEGRGGGTGLALSRLLPP